eukprot:13008778-Alexandrium_andersonii.AAC.1
MASTQAELLTWSADKLAREGDPQAADVRARAAKAVAAFGSLRKAQATDTADGMATDDAPAASSEAAAP